MNNIDSLKQMTDEELQNELMNLRKQQFTMRMKKATGTLDKTHFVKQVRKRIAQVKTLMTEKAVCHEE